MSTSDSLEGGPLDLGALTELANALYQEHTSYGALASQEGVSPSAPLPPAGAPSSTAWAVTAPRAVGAPSPSLPPEITNPFDPSLVLGSVGSKSYPAHANPTNTTGPHGRSPSAPTLPTELRGLEAGDAPAVAGTSGAIPQLPTGARSAGGSPYYFIEQAPAAAPAAPGLAAPPTLAAPTSLAAPPTLAAPTSLPSAPTAFGVPTSAPSASSLGAPTAPAYDAASRARLLSGVSAVVTPAVTTSTLGSQFDIAKVRNDFPILSERVNGQSLVWLDNAATTQKPKVVIERLARFYEHENSNIHRAAHELAARATDAYEGARETVRRFLGARSANEIVFVRGTTEGINLIASAWGRQNIGAGDEIVLSHLEHHANIVPWQLLAQEKGAKLRVIPVDDDGQILLAEYGRLLGPRTKLVSFTHVSNALGTITPAREMVAMAKAAGITTLVDGAQSVSHMPVDVQTLGSDFYVFSGHKVFGPTGIGAVYGREDLLNQMAPYQGGGNMIQDVTFERTVFHPAPARFEAGTGNIADAVGLGAALEYVSHLGMAAIGAYEHALLDYGTQLLSGIPGLRLIGTAANKASVLSFTLDGFRTDEVSTRLNEDGIAVRGGHHCAQPILRRFGLESTVRPSLAFYNDCADVERLAESVTKIAASRAKKAFVP